MKFIKANRPFIKSNNSISKMMNYLLISLLPIILFAFYKNGIIPFIKGYTNVFEMLYPLIFVITGAFTTSFVEYIYFKFIKKEKNPIKSLKESYPYITGILLSLILPINTPIYILIIGCVIAEVVGKLIYGGFGNNIFNPALIGGLFVITMYGSLIGSNGGYLNKYELDTISSATPLTNVSSLSAINYDNVVKPYGSLNDFFIGTIPGSIGETSALLCIIAFIFLSYKKVIKWKIPVFYVGTVFFMTYIIGTFNGYGIWYPIFQVLSGGLLFGAIFMADDPVTSPVTTVGEVIYGICLGILTVVFRFLSNLPEGVMTSILTLNMFVTILDRIGVVSGSSFKKSLFYILILMLISLCLCYKISYDLKHPSNNNSYNIISIDSKDNRTVYTVSEKGHGGLIKAKITFLNNKIINFEILENNETASYYQKIKNEKYIDKLISNQDDIDSVDTISGATVSSSAIKSMIKNTISNYRREQNE